LLPALIFFYSGGERKARRIGVYLVWFGVHEEGATKEKKGAPAFGCMDEKTAT